MHLPSDDCVFTKNTNKTKTELLVRSTTPILAASIVDEQCRMEPIRWFCVAEMVVWREDGGYA